MECGMLFVLFFFEVNVFSIIVECKSFGGLDGLVCICVVCDFDMRFIYLVKYWGGFSIDFGIDFGFVIYFCVVVG